MSEDNESSCDKFDTDKPEKMFSLKKWNAVAMWSWDVECDTCAICRVQVMGECRLRREAPQTLKCLDMHLCDGTRTTITQQSNESLRI